MSVELELLGAELPGVRVADVVSVELELPVSTSCHGDLMFPHFFIDKLKLVLENQLTRCKIFS